MIDQEGGAEVTVETGYLFESSEPRNSPRGD